MHLITFLAGVPDIGTGAPPPGSENLLKIARWVLWGCSIACVLGIVLVGTQMAIAHSHGEMQTHGKKLGLAMAGCFVVGASSLIAGALI
jgi:hypothetical protein